MRRVLAFAALAAIAVVGFPAAAAEDAVASYTDDQVARAEPLYASTCALCHGVDLTGGPGSPALAGPEFTFSWNGKPAAELFDYIKGNMPPGQQGSLSDAQYADLMARILKANGVPAGQTELPADPGRLAQLKIVPKR